MSARRQSQPKSPTPNVQLLFVAGFGPIVRDVSASRALYATKLGIAFDEQPGGYLHTDKIDGVKHFALWPLAQAAESCFGTDSWPTDVPVPQAWVEFEAADIEQATAALKAQGLQLLVSARTEPWGQVVTRFLSPEGLLVGVTHTPWLRPSP